MKRYSPELRHLTIVIYLLFVSISLSAKCVYLKELQSSQKKDDNLLTWTTLSEEDHAFFLIERSYNGIQYEEAGRVEGAGTSQEKHSYSFTDINQPALRVFYRLVEVDMEGKVNITNSVLVNRKGDDYLFEITTIESNTVQRYFNFTIASKIEAPLEYRLQTKMGLTLKTGQIELVKGQNAVAVDLQGVDVDSYQFSIRIKNEIEVFTLKKVDEAVVPESILSIKDR